MITRGKRRAKIHSRKRAQPSKRKVRLAIECSPEERKYIKMVAAHEEKTVNEFVLECVRMRVYECTHHHTPNKATEAALIAAEEGAVYNFGSVGEFFKAMEE